MTTVLTASCFATTGRRSKRCFLTSPAAAQSSRRKNVREKVRNEQGREASRHRAASDRGDDPALLVSADFIVAAPAGAGVLAGAANRHLGFPAELHLAERRILRPRRQ